MRSGFWVQDCCEYREAAAVEKGGEFISLQRLSKQSFSKLEHAVKYTNRHFKVYIVVISIIEI